MIYICNECNKIFDDDNLKCTCDSTDIDELFTCVVCEGEYKWDDIDNNVCFNCLSGE